MNNNRNIDYNNFFVGLSVCILNAVIELPNLVAKIV